MEAERGEEAAGGKVEANRGWLMGLKESSYFHNTEVKEQVLTGKRQPRSQKLWLSLSVKVATLNSRFAV